MTAVSPGAVDKLTPVTIAAVVGGAGVLAISIWTLTASQSFGGWFATGALATYAVAGVIVVARIGAYHPYPRFGAANAVTLSRLILTSLFAGLAAETAVLDTAVAADTAWLFTGLAVFTLILDGLDGWLARRSGLASPLGARFDMETDALLILLLSVLALNLDKAGPWVLLGGLLRYIFVAAGWIWPALAQPLLPSRRRQAICGLQCGALTALLSPMVMPPLSAFFASTALGLLILSFGQDAYWALGNPVLRSSQR